MIERMHRVFAVTVSLSLLFVACTPSESDSPPTLPPLTVTAPSVDGDPVVPVEVDPALLEPLPIDRQVIIGSLENGLTYFVRENDSPGQRAQLRLVVNAGSVLEESDQAGVAHYLEHMLFNGTEAFPKNDLIATLESFGAQFGPDVNAYTSYDETVYELEIATDRVARLETAFDVLYQWAAAATLDPVDIDEERGVVIEEWRLRDQGIGGRISNSYQELLLRGTSYEGHAPIGSLASLEALDVEAIRRFYDTWYRPEMMAVVAVGDFDAGRIEDMITERFSEMPAGDGGLRAEVTERVAPSPRVVRLIDPEYPSAFVSVFFSAPVGMDQATVGGLRSRIATDLALTMVHERLSNDISRGEAAFFEVDVDDFGFVRTLSIIGIELTAEPERLEASLQAGVEEMSRVVQFGFSDVEFDRARERFRASLDQLLAGKDTTQDYEYADLYVAHFLDGDPIAAIEDVVEMSARIVDSMTVADVQNAVLGLVDGVQPAVLLVAPAADEASVLSEIDVLEVLSGLDEALITARAPEVDLGDRLMATPEPSEIVERTSNRGLGFVEIELENGVRAIFKETTISENGFSVQAWSPGGYSMFEDGSVPGAQLIGDIVTTSGVGQFDQVALERILSDRLVGLSVFIEETNDSMFGQSSTDDAETLFQLIHLYMTQPRADASAAEALLNQYRPYAANPDQVPSLAQSIALYDARYGDEVRYRAIPTAGELAAFDMEDGLDAYRLAVADADDWVFAFAGDFDTDDLVELARRYLGTLPAVGDGPDVWVNFQPDAPNGIVRRVVESGSDPQGSVVVFLTGELVSNPQLRIHARLLELVAESRLRNRLREALAATYSPFVSVEFFDRPANLIETYISIGGDPDRLEEISSETAQVLADIRSSGPTADELATAQEQLTREYELVSNPFWVETMLFYAEYLNEDPADVFRRIGIVADTTSDDLREIATIAWPPGQYIEVLLLPET